MYLIKYLFWLNVIFIAYLPQCFSALSPHDVVDAFDLKMYRPQSYGMQDVVFEVRIVGLTKRLKQRIGIERLSDVFFRVYWAFPGKYDIEVLGLPKGFVQIKKELSDLVMAKIDFVIPKKVSGQLRSYLLTGSKDNKTFIVKGVDKSGKRDISEAYFYFDDKNLLKKMRLLSPTGEKISEITYKQAKLSKGKYLIKNMIARLNVGIKTTVMKNSIEYKPVSGVVLPIRIAQEVTDRINQPVGLKKGKPIENKTKSLMVLSNYVINEGVAMKYIISKHKGSVSKGTGK